MNLPRATKEKVKKKKGMEQLALLGATGRASRGQWRGTVGASQTAKSCLHRRGERGTPDMGEREREEREIKPQSGGECERQKDIKKDE